MSRMNNLILRRGGGVPPPATKLERFPAGLAAKAFYERFFPGTSPADWADWRWQMRNRIRDRAALERIFTLSPSEQEALALHQGPLPVAVTPYYASLMDRHDPAAPLRRTHIMTMEERVRSPGEADDPLGEDHDSPVRGIVHRYPDRVLFLLTGACSTYCRYCTRSRVVGQPGGQSDVTRRHWEGALAYIEAHCEVRDVLLSGGDPLTFGDDRLNWLLGRLRNIPHVDFIRIGTKVPIVLPQRVTRDLVKVLKRYKPWISLHVTHPDEFTTEVKEATARLADAGLPLGGQTVLLKGINDDPAVMTRLMHAQLVHRVKPYYLYMCDPITGSAHFRTSVAKGLEIMAALRGHTTGYASPTFVIDAPGGGGKVALLPNAIVDRDGDDLLLRNFEGAVFRYPDPLGGVMAAPLRNPNSQALSLAEPAIAPERTV
jgi:lysine 2,3-aminomutase